MRLGYLMNSSPSDLKRIRDFAENYGLPPGLPGRELMEELELVRNFKQGRPAHIEGLLRRLEMLPIEKLKILLYLAPERQRARVASQLIKRGIHAPNISATMNYLAARDVVASEVLKLTNIHMGILRRHMKNMRKQ
ncbi:MAG: hypothetical protein V1835_05345 [Candidatus Micrarchaeota archaeon]